MQTPVTSLIRRWATAVVGLALVAAGPRAAHADDAFSNLSFSVAPTFIKSTQSDQIAPGAPAGTGSTDTVRLNYGAAYRFDNRDSLSYDNATAAFTLGRVYIPVAHGTYPLYVGTVVDHLQTLAFKHAVNSAVQINAGYFWRSRSCCPGDNDPRAAVHAGYGGDFVGTEVNFVKLPRGGALFTYAARALYVPHHPTSELQAQYPGITIVSNRFILPESLTMHVPFVWDRKLHPFITYAHGANYFNNEAIPEQQNIMNYGFVRQLRHNFTLRAAIFNLKQTHQAASFPGLETARYTNFDAGLTYASPF